MSHTILFSAVIVGSFIMQAQESANNDCVARTLWGIVGFAAFFAGWIVP